MKPARGLICGIGLVIFLTGRVFAATSLSVSNLPTTIDQAQELEVDVNLSCSSCTSDSYLRSVFYPSGTSYFGYTQNKTGEWINAPGANCTQYYQILNTELVEGTWSGKLKSKPDIANAFYNGPGEYLFKVGRYTPSCSSPTWSSEGIITITGPTPTPTPTPTSLPTSTPVPTNTPNPTATNTPVPSSTPTKTPIPTIIVTSPTGIIEAAPSTSVLGVQNKTESSPNQTNKSIATALIIIAVGLLCLAGGIIAYNRNICKH